MIVHYSPFNFSFRFKLIFEFLRKTPHSKPINGSWVWRGQWWCFNKENPWLIPSKNMSYWVWNSKVQGWRRPVLSLARACFKFKNIYCHVMISWLCVCVFLNVDLIFYLLNALAITKGSLGQWMGVDPLTPRSGVQPPAPSL